MKKQINRKLRLSIFSLLITVMLFSSSNCYSQNFSTISLYLNGHKSYLAQDYIYASVYLFAYIQRNPTEFQDKDYKAEVIAAYDYSVKQLNNQKASYKRLLAMQKPTNDNDDNASVSSGLSTQPPRLRSAPPPVRNQ